jgi:nucleoside-diphosphate kinase
MDIHKQRSLVLLKPDAIQRSLVGEVISRIERTGLKIVAIKMVVATREQIIDHYHKDEAWFLRKGTKIVENRKESGKPIEKEAIEYGRDIIEQNVKFMLSGPIIALIIEGGMAPIVIKKITGDTAPTLSDVGTIRGDFSIDSYEHAAIDARAVRNILHCSENTDDAEREIKVWFTDKEIISYRLVQEQVLYDVNIDGIFE